MRVRGRVKLEWWFIIGKERKGDGKGEGKKVCSMQYAVCIPRSLLGKVNGGSLIGLGGGE